MALSLRSNLIANQVASSLSHTQTAIQDVLSRIATGRRVVSARDDAAGSAVAINLSVRARSGLQAVRNSNDAVSVLATAVGAAAEVEHILQRMRELAVQSASETLATTERAYVFNEFDKLEDEFSRISQTTEFNGQALTDGTTSSLTVQVGITGGTSSEISVILPDLAGFHGMITTADVSSASNAQTAIDTVDTVHDLLNAVRARMGAQVNRLESARTYQVAHAAELTGAVSRIEDADMAHETAKLASLQVRQRAGVAALAQARQMHRSIISLLG